MRPAMNDRPVNQHELRLVSRQDAGASVGCVVSLEDARRRQEQARCESEESRLERLVIERWTGRGELEV